MPVQPEDDGSDNRPLVYEEGALTVYRGSGIGMASHALAAARAGITPTSFTARTLQVMNEGKLHEPAILARLAEDGWLLERIGSDQDELMVPITSTVYVRCHPDGYAVATQDHPFAPKGTRCVVEAKSMSKDVFGQWERDGFKEFQRYAVQLTLQMVGSGLPGLFVVKNRNDGTQRWQVFHEPPVAFAEIRKRLMLIDKGAREGDLNPLKEKCPDPFFCRFHFLHDDGESVVETVVDDIIDGLAEMVDQARERKRRAEAVEKQAREKLQLALAGKGMDEVRTARWRVVSYSTSRKRYDFKQALADGVDLAPYEKVSEFRAMKVTALGKEDK